MDNVPLIIPLLEKEYRSATRKMNEINQELRFLTDKAYSFKAISRLDAIYGTLFSYTLRAWITKGVQPLSKLYFSGIINI